MSKFLKNLSSSGINVQSRYSARGRGGLVGPSTQINLDVRFPLESFIKAVATKERKVLYFSGRYAQRTFRSQLRRIPPKKTTKRGNMTKRYREEVMGKATRAPYRRSGILYRSVDFTVDERLGRFDSGPPLITGLRKTSKSNQAVPGLLDQGGPAIVRIAKRRRRKRGKPIASGTPSYKWERRMYRQFPYQTTVFDKTTKFFKKKIEELRF